MIKLWLFWIIFILLIIVCGKFSISFLLSSSDFLLFSKERAEISSSSGFVSVVPNKGEERAKKKRMSGVFKYFIECNDRVMIPFFNGFVNILLWWKFILKKVMGERTGEIEMGMITPEQIKGLWYYFCYKNYKDCRFGIAECYIVFSSIIGVISIVFIAFR